MRKRIHFRSRQSGLLGIRPGVWLSAMALIVIVLIVAFSRRGTKVPAAEGIADQSIGVGEEIVSGSRPQILAQDDDEHTGDAAIPPTSINAKGPRLQFGGTVLILPEGWTQLHQPETVFVQQRAVSTSSNISLSAGAFKHELPVKYYVSLGVASLVLGPEKNLERVAKETQMPLQEVEKLLESTIGRQTMEQLKSSFATMDFDFIGRSQLMIGPVSAYEIRSRIIYRETGQVVYSREFVYAGKASQEIVTVTYVSSSDDIYRDRTLVDAIHPAPSSSVDNDNLTQVIVEQDGGFSYAVPADWIRTSNKNKGIAPRIKFDGVKGPNVLGYPAGKITPLGWNIGNVDVAAQTALEALRREGGRRTIPNVSLFSTKQGVSGKRFHPAHDFGDNEFITIYAFKLDASRVVTFLCWPSRGDRSDLLTFYDNVMNTVALLSQH